MSGKRRSGFDIRQMQIDWNGVKSAPPVDPSAQLSQQDSAGTSVTMAPPTATNPQPVLRLRWDFRTHFPQPLPDAVDAGVMAAEDALPQSVEAIHREHGRRMLGVLSDLDAAMDERRRTPPDLTRPASDRINEPTRLQRWYASLLGVYEEWFGREAAEAFDRAVRAWHAHIEVVVDRDTAPSSNAGSIIPATPSPALMESNEVAPLAIEAEVSDAQAPAMPPTRRLSDSGGRRIIARLPVPKPLPEAVAAGHFGMDEQGQPINPSADEVHAITNDHAEMLIELIQSLPSSGRPSSPSLESEIRAGIAKYAEDFGGHAAQRLEAYCRRQARVRDEAPVPRGR